MNAQVIPFPTDYAPIEPDFVANAESWIAESWVAEVLVPVENDELDAAYRRRRMIRASWVVAFIALLVLVMS